MFTVNVNEIMYTKFVVCGLRLEFRERSCLHPSCSQAAWGHQSTRCTLGARPSPSPRLAPRDRAGAAHTRAAESSDVCRCGPGARQTRCECAFSAWRDWPLSPGGPGHVTGSLASSWPGPGPASCSSSTAPRSCSASTPRRCWNNYNQNLNWYDIQDIPNIMLYPVSEPCEENYEDTPGGPDDQQGCKVFKYILQ